MFKLPRRHLSLLLFACLAAPTLGQGLQPGDHVVYIGNTFADRMQHHAWLETYIHALLPEHQLTFRNLGFSGDEISLRQRSQDFGTPDEWLTKCQADVVFCFFGFNESFAGASGLSKFSDELAEMIDHMRGQKYNGTSAPRIAVFSPIAHEQLESRHLPDGTANNKNLALYTQAMKRICEIKEVLFVDLFSASQDEYKQATKPLTVNGIHLLDHGNKKIAQAILKHLVPDQAIPADADVKKLRDAVLEKNYYWFSRYRVVDGYNVFGGRSRLDWPGFDGNPLSNADVMKREMEIFDVMTANRDKRVWAVAQGGDLELKDDNLPEEIAVKTNKPGVLDDEKHAYLGGEEAIEKMTVHKDMQVNLFASEEQFPRLVNPVQIAVDTNSRLWVSVWPSYPHWNPTEPRRDAIIILPDEDNDGQADECIVFADELNSITGFEFWNDGVIVAAPPELWYLQDTDGDDRADRKVRMLQGISSADTHHSANAMVLGPGGWLYWSRGIFNVAAFETPTGVFRSGNSGVYRFNPRTFQIEFHYPIGPNPHGDVFDQWGFQFANDGTSGTGGYVSIGKGQRPRGKQWFKKDERPVAATGLLSSSHFPKEHQGNFLICNTIGFLGVLNYQVQYNGAEITAVRVEDIVRSGDPNFRPSDIEVGGDGALYVSDWHNVLIGHMQHNMRDPNRDHDHGRIYRISAKGRDPLQPAKLRGKPIAELCQQFFAKENAVRYRTRLELTGRSAKEIKAEVGRFVESLDVTRTDERDEAQALLECLWVFEEQRLPNMELLRRVVNARDARVRAAAIRTLGHWAGRVEGWQPVLLAAARDDAALVRAEAVKAAIEFKGVDSAEIVFEVATRERDPELDDVLAYAEQQIDVAAVVADALKSRRALSKAAYDYVLQNAAVEDLQRLDPAPEVFQAILGRKEANAAQLSQALTGLANTSRANRLEMLLQLLADAPSNGGNLQGLGEILTQTDAPELAGIVDRLEELATRGANAALRQFGYAAWVAASDPRDAFLAASQSKDRLRDFLTAVPRVRPEVRETLHAMVAPLIAELPAQLREETSGTGILQPGVQVDYFRPKGKDVRLETLAKLTPQAQGVVPEISLRVPQRTAKEGFALRFTGLLHIPVSGQYTFYLGSDDGSRLYINDREVIDNDGNHGMTIRRGQVSLSAGPHKFILTYANNTGSEGLSLQWAGPNLERQKLTPDRLTVSGGETLHDVAIRALATIPGHDKAKFEALAKLVAQGRHRATAISALSSIKKANWPNREIRPLVDNLVGYLSEMPAQMRASAAAVETMDLAKGLASMLPPNIAGSIEARLQNLDVRVIAIGTVPTRMIFDKERIVVEAGKPVEFRFSNTDHMPHNLVVTRPGQLREVGELGEATGRDVDAADRGFVPESPSVLMASRLLQPGQTQSMVFEVPDQPGVYPYVCTYPGHWRRMYGALYVVADLERYQLDPEAYLAANPVTIEDELLSTSSRGREWKLDDLIGSMKPFPGGRSFEVGKELFRVASCTGCHQLNNVGTTFGPDLAKLDPKKRTVDHVLRSILEPSSEIDDKYRSVSLLLDSGKVVTGMVVRETDSQIEIVVDPLAKDAAEIIDKDKIEERLASNVSLMPQGLLDKLTREEILDLMAYVLARGDKDSELFSDHHH